MKIVRMKVGEWGKLRAFFDVETTEGIVIKGFKLIEGINGIFVSNPSVKDDDGNYQDQVFLRKPTKDVLTEMALKCHKQNGVTDRPTRSIGGISEIAKIKDDIPF